MIQLRSENLTIGQKGLLMVAVPLVFEIVFVSVVAQQLFSAEHELNRIENAKEILMKAHALEATVIGSMMRILPEDSEGDKKEEFAELEQSLEKQNRELKKQIANSPDFSILLPSKDQVFQKVQSLLKKSKSIYADKTIPARKRMKYLRNEFYDTLIATRPYAQKILDIESKIKAQEPKQLQHFQILFIALIAAGVCVMIATSTFLVRFFSQNILQRVQAIGEHAASLSTRQPLGTPVAGRDEIATLDAVLFKMNKILQSTLRHQTTILHYSADVLLSLHENLTIGNCSAAAKRLWSYEPDELTGRSFLALLHERAQEAIKEELSHSKNSGQATVFEAAVRCAGAGEEKKMLFRACWFNEGKSFFCTAHDITERQRIQEMKQRLLSIASHDLRTPLSSIAGTLSFLRARGQAQLGEKTFKSLEKADINMQRALDLIQELLDLKKLEAGKITGEFRCVSAFDVCSLAIESVSDLAEEFRVRLIIQGGDAAVLADEKRLTQALVNLLTNAIKRSPKDRNVELSIKQIGYTVEISIGDQSPPVSARQQKVFFDKFEQTNEQANQMPGTGLGLSIAKAIIDAHSGKIGLQPFPDTGNRLFVQIPAYRDAEEGAEK